MHYQCYRRLRELRSIIILVVEVDETRPEQDRRVISGDTRAKAKARDMVQLIGNQ